MNFSFFFQAMTIISEDILIVKSVQHMKIAERDASQHYNDSRFCSLLSLLLLCLSFLGLFHPVPHLWILTKRRPWWRGPDRGCYQSWTLFSSIKLATQIHGLHKHQPAHCPSIKTSSSSWVSSNKRRRENTSNNYGVKWTKNISVLCECVLIVLFWSTEKYIC